MKRLTGIIWLTTFVCMNKVAGQQVFQQEYLHPLHGVTEVSLRQYNRTELQRERRFNGDTMTDGGNTWQFHPYPQFLGRNK